MWLKILSIIARAIAGGFFIFSAIVKLYPTAILEVAIVETGLISWPLVPYAARLLIGFELFLGLLLISGFYSRLTIKISIATLIFFTIYLGVILIVQGNQENCNCLGMQYEMTPLQSIIKNIFLVLALLFSHKYAPETRWKYSLFIVIALFVMSLITPFVLSKIYIYTESPAPVNKTLNFEATEDIKIISSDSINIEEGKWVIGLMSTSCPHCIVAGYKLSVINNSIDNLPVFFYIVGTDEGLESFHFSTKTRDIPYSIINILDALKLFSTNKLAFPGIYFVENGTIKYRASTNSFTESDIKDWLSN